MKSVATMTANSLSSFTNFMQGLPEVEYYIQKFSFQHLPTSLSLDQNSTFFCIHHNTDGRPIQTRERQLKGTGSVCKDIGEHD
jgi:hypothetical protein